MGRQPTGARSGRQREIGADYVLGVRTDELDIQRLVLYDLQR